MSASDAGPEFPFVVCLGASAGGLEALEAFFRMLPGPVGVPFVVITHLSPDFKSLMPDLLAKHTDLPVFAATHEATLAPDNVYIIPAGKNMALQGAKIMLRSQERGPGHALNLPIDLFLESLAAEFGARSVAVILSGTGGDGSRGIRFVKEAGGIVFVQEPASAKFDGMPRSALTTGLVDKTGTPQWLAERIAYLTGRDTPPLSLANDEDDDPEFAVWEHDDILRLLRRALSLDVSYLRMKMVDRRIRRRMAIQGLSDLDEYVQLLRDDADEVKQLGRDLLIGVTRFFRDDHAFEVLEQKVIPEIVLSVPENQPIRVWVSACSTGNEVYSLVILLLEAMRVTGVNRELKVFATDVDEHALDRASRGAYSMNEVLDVPMPLLTRYFDKNGDEYVIRDVVRQNVIYARHNLVVDPPFTKIHLLSCRNLLIYLEAAARQKVLSSLVSALHLDSGILFLGASEAPMMNDDTLSTVDVRARIYRRTRHRPRLPLAREGMGNDPIERVGRATQLSSERRESRDRAEARLLRNVLEMTFEAENRTAVIIDDHDRVVQILTDPLHVLRMPKGKPTDELSRMASSSLIAAVSTARQQLRAGQDVPGYLAVAAGPDGADLRVEVLSLTSPTEPLSQYLLVMRLVEASVVDDAESTRISSVSAERVAALETELRQTKENLQATIEELQSSSEEQQSTNEELIASNEELQSTNEELLSVNEELYTVNSEYHKKNEELQLLTTDLDNLLNSTEVATLYLDADLRVRKFTPSIARVLPLQASDHGRPIGDLTNQLDTDLVKDIEQVLRSDRALEREVRDRGKAWVLMRISPYRGPGGRDFGVLVTFVDVTRIKNAEETARVISEKLVVSNQKLLAQSEQLEDLFSVVAHDLKTPTARIERALANVREALTQGRVQDATEVLATVQEVNNTVAGMLRELADVSQLRQLDVQIAEVDLHGWLGATLEPFLEAAGSRGVELAWACDHGRYRFARSAVEAVLGNLVENALQHGTVASEDCPPRIDVTVQVDDACLRLSVSDNGAGIDPQDHGRLFDLYRRVDRERPARAGVGLVAARRMTERAHGSLKVESDVGQGARFIAELPVYDPDGRSSAAVSHPILIVDDDPVDTKRVRLLLEQYPLRWARTLSEAMDELNARRFSLIILDLSLPDGHGLSLASSSVADLNADTPIVILSGQLEGIPPEALDAARVQATFTKDQIESPQFLKAVEQALQGVTRLSLRSAASTAS